MPANKDRLWHLTALTLAASGTLLAAWVALGALRSATKTEYSADDFLFSTYFLLPWPLLDALYLLLRLPRSTALAAGLGLLVEGGVRSVFIASGSSADPLGDIAKAVLQVVLMVPGLALGGLADRAAAGTPGQKDPR